MNAHTKTIGNTYLIYPFLLYFFLFSSCRPIESSDDSLELTLIKTVIEKESMAFCHRDYQLWATCYKQDDQTFWVHIENNKLLEARGWTELQGFAKEYMKVNPKSRGVHIARDNYHARIADNIAWVTFDEMQIENTKTRHFRGVRILEKVDKHWKISYVNSYDAPM